MKFWKIWRWPVAIALLSSAALLLGLLYDGLWDWLATLVLGLPVLLSLWFGCWAGRESCHPPGG